MPSARILPASEPAPSWSIALILWAFIALPLTATAADNTARVASPISDFSLKDPSGRSFILSQLPGRYVVIAFLGTECPLAKLYATRLQEMHEQYAPRGVSFLGVDSNSQDSIVEIAAFARVHKLAFPVTKDPGNRVADLFGARRTPEVFVVDRERNIQYQGRIDDQYGVGFSRDQPTTHDLRDALDSLLDGRSPKTASTEAVGCHIGRLRDPQPDALVTYSSHIAAIMNKHCVECHRDGEIAPFALTEYDEVAAWSETIAEVIHNGRMPPWHANPEHGEFSNARNMTTRERQLVYDWVDAGAPMGDPSEAPAIREFAKVDWLLGEEPDQVVSMRSRPFIVPAQGTVEYQYFIADPGFTKDMWIKAAEIMPGNRRVVHHAIIFIRPPDGVRQRGLGWLTAYVPGQAIMQLDDGMARRVPAGSKFIFQMHYTTAGTPQEDLTQVGLVFAAPDKVRDEVVTLVAINRDFEIPPDTPDFLVEAELAKAPQDGRLLSIAPHMHVRGKSFQVHVKQGSDEEQLLLDVPHYDFNWQHAYRLKEPIAMKDLRVRCQAMFDNSSDNLVNPDPKITVRWGDQTWEEMMIAFFEVALPRESAAMLQSNDRLSPKQRQRATRSVDRLLQRWDKNDDDAIGKRETSQANAFLVFAFNKMDANRDGRITRAEALEYAFREELQKRRD